MKLTSPAFQDREKIPPKYTCDGENISPPLNFFEVPKESKSLVLIMDDPDVPKQLRADGMWDHWVVFNIPPNVRQIAAGAHPPGVLGMGTHGAPTYLGPAPPDREHRYFFKLFALDCLLDLPEGSTKSEVEKAMQGHVIDQAPLMGRYEKKN